MKYKAIVFDLDGTLLDTLGDILVAINGMLKTQDIDSVTYEQLKGMIGDGARKMVERALGDNKRDIDECVKIYNQIYEKTTSYTKPFEGICDLLGYLKSKNIKMSILSNKPQNDAEVIVSRVLAGYEFVDIIGQSEKFPVKPDTKGLYEIVKNFGYNIDDCLYIGDGEMDYVTPNKVGMKVLCSLWGYRTKAQLAAVGATEFIDSPSEISKFF